MSESVSAPQLSGQMFLFERPEIMSKEAHGDFGFNLPKHRFGFCSKVRAIPITVSEIPAAMRDYPIIFVSKEQLTPLAVVGLVDDVNLFVDENGDWESNRYIPGYVRRYPFGAANETGGDRIAVVIDTAFDGLVKGGEKPLFENGEPSETTQQGIDFCRAFEKDRQLTSDFSDRLATFDVVEGQSAQYTPSGETEQKSFAEYFGVDEAKLKALSDEQVLELHKTGLMPILYAQLMSMQNWRLLLGRRATRFGLTDDKTFLNPAVN